MAMFLNRICQRSLMALPFRKFLQGTTRLPLVSQEFCRLKTTSIEFQDKKNKTPAKQSSFVTNQVRPSTSDKLKNSEIIGYFKNPSALDSKEDSNFIQKDEINDVRKNYKFADINHCNSVTGGAP